ncbi:MAG: hypothetical protein Q8R15_03170 [Candidatus Micrarchaeota archaeon]|nr:hypothetical protein [Candidatus Micrarchaeota archaeon]
MTLDQLLLDLGVNVAGNFVYDTVRNYIAASTAPTRQELQSHIARQLNVIDAEIVADRIVDFLAQNGDILIQGTRIYAKDSITYQSSTGAKFELRDNVVSQTSKSSIIVGNGASVTGRGGAKIIQRDDGSIVFGV